MYNISNRQLRLAIRFIELYREKVDVKTCGNKEYNARRLAGILLRQLKAKEPIRMTSSARPQTDTDDTKTREPAHGRDEPKGLPARTALVSPTGGLSFPDENEDKKQDI